MTQAQTALQPIRWQNNALQLLDQRLLPHQQIWLHYDDANAVATAIRDMVVRGAPAIGVTAAYGVVLAARHAWAEHNQHWKQAMPAAIECLAQSRPTAVNLFWALEKMQNQYQALPDNLSPEPDLLRAAQQIHQQDIAANQQMGKLGAELLAPNSRVLTHCNAGALATAGYGTALGVIRHGFTTGKIEHVYVDETRPWLQGSRLTAWELMQEQIPMTLQSDSVAASLMAAGKVDWVIVGADRIAANGDVANKIGTYSLAVLAKYHHVKVMVVAPMSTIDWQLAEGNAIPIEQRPAEEVTQMQGLPIAPAGVNVFNPAFDVTPATLIDAIVTEAGVILSPNKTTMQTLKKEEL